jgi:hypothetical protein
MKTTTIEMIKKAALQLLGVTLSDDISGLSIPELIEKDDTYAQYLVNMDVSINRAIARMVQAEKLPHKSFTVLFSEEYTNGITVSGNAMTVPLSVCGVGVRALERVDFVDAYGRIDSDVDYGVMGESDIVLPILKSGERYVMIYSYLPATVSTIMELSQAAKDWKADDIEMGGTGDGAYNKNVVDVPDELAIIIPEYIFGDLFMHDEPTIAMIHGKNVFEAELAAYNPPISVKNNKIENIFQGFN